MANTWIILPMLVVCLSNISARPSDDGSTTRVIYEEPTDVTDDVDVNDGEDQPAEQIRANVEYLPFYGGAKGQYLEVKTNNRGAVLSETIVSEENISSENIVKNVDENLLSKVLGKNLQSLQALSSGLMKLHNLGRKTGGLSGGDKDRFKTQLTSLGATASNTIKLIDEIGENIEVLFKSTKRQYQEDEDVGEEGVGIDTPVGEEGPIVIDGSTIAEAKPVGLAVIGEHGLAASRPQATAVAVSGIALARPIATAIAGVNPAQLGIDFQAHKARSS